MVYLPPKRPPARTLFRLGFDWPEPSFFYQSLKEGLCLLGVEALTKRLPAHFLARYLLPTVLLNPSQHTPGIGVALAETDLPQNR